MANDEGGCLAYFQLARLEGLWMGLVKGKRARQVRKILLVTVYQLYP